jgi:hypothetical protein
MIFNSSLTVELRVTKDASNWSSKRFANLGYKRSQLIYSKIFQKNCLSSDESSACGLSYKHFTIVMTILKVLPQFGMSL